MEARDPDYRILMKYDIRASRQDAYYRYVLGEFVPLMQSLGLQMIFAWHVYGDGYPERQIEFVCDTKETLQAVLANRHFQQAEDTLKAYINNYERKIVRFKNRFQF